MMNSPCVSPRLCAGMALPLPKAIGEATLTFNPAQVVMLPSVVTRVASGFKITLRPAVSNTLPLVVVMGALILASRPQHTTTLPLTAVMAAFTFTSRRAFILKVVVLGVAVQLTASLTLMSPLPGVAVKRLVTGGVPATVLSVPVSVLMVTLLVTSRAESVAPEMLPVAETVKSWGSISQLPVTPKGAAVVIFAWSVTFTLAAEVSIKPPSPPLGALASKVPLTFTSPFCISPIRLIVPLRLSRVRASMMPELLTAVRKSALAELAVIGADQAAILGQGVHRTLIDCDGQQAVARHVQGHGIAGRQRHRAHPGRYHPLIADIGSQQRHRTAIGGDRALIDHRACA